MTLTNFEIDCFEESSMPTTVSMSRCSQSESLESSLSVSLHEVEMPAVTKESLSVSPHEVEMPAVTEEASPLPSYLNLSRWISVLLIKLQAKYKLSDNVMLAFVSVLRLLFAIISHPLQYYFPRTIQGLSIQLGVNSMLEYTKFIVCPNSECCELYSTTFQLDTSEIHKCTKLHYGLQCNKPLLYEKFLSFGKRRFVPYKMFIYLSPITWLKMFYGNESFKELLSVQLQHTTGKDCLEDVWDGRV